VREAVRTRHHSLRTEEAYLRRVRQYILFCGKRHPSELGAREVSAFISHLAVERKVAGSTRTQALSALLFLYRGVPALPIGWVDDVERAKEPRRLPVVFNREEARAVLGHLREESWLMASLLYGSGPRPMECVRLRVKDLDLARLAITARDGKGGKERVTVLPTSLIEPLERQPERARAQRVAGLREGPGTSTSLTRSPGSTRPPSASGAGSTSSRPATAPATRGRGVSGATTSPRRHCKRRSNVRSEPPGSPSRGAVTPSATASPRT
jgi:integrase